MTLSSRPFVGLLHAALFALLACGGGGGSSSSSLVSPSSVKVQPGETVSFEYVAAAAGPTVTWSIEEGTAGGTITETGKYTAPGTTGTFHVVAQVAGDATQAGRATVVVADPSAPPDAGTGMTHPASYVTTSGAGSMPSLASAAVARCAGNGSTDDTACLQGAIDAARAAGKPLTLPATGSYYKISAPLIATTSIIGTDGMPTIRTTNSGSGYDERGAILQVAASNVWISNLHLVGTYGGGGSSTGAQSAGPNISLGNVSHVTIQGNHLEGAQGDSISDHYQEMDGGSGGVRDVLVRNNTLERPYRCCISLVALVDRWAILDNVCDKQGNDSSSPFDWEPWQAASSITNVELGYNYVTLWSGSSPESPVINVNGWFDPSPGGNIYVHHNYGSWPDNNYGGFAGKNGNWTNVVFGPNERGEQPPP